jgi:hypothetical protein
MKPPTHTICYHFRSFPMLELSQPLSLPMFLFPKKEGGKLFALAYLRFLSAHKETIPTTQVSATAASMTISIVTSGASVVAAGSAGVGSVGANAAAGCAGSA